MRSLKENPIKLFSFIVILLSLILLIGCQFHCPDIYTNREVVHQVVNEHLKGIRPYFFIEDIKNFINYDYYKYNLIFHQWGFWISALLFTIIFKISNFKKFLELKIFNNKKLIYLWINIIYIIGGILYFIIYKNHYNYTYTYTYSINKYVNYITQVIFLLGIIYYSITNYLTYITFNTNIKSKLCKYSWYFIFLIMVFSLLWTYTMKFIFINILLDFCYVLWIIYIVCSLKYIQNKKQKEEVEQDEDLISKNDIFMYFMISVTYIIISFMYIDEIYNFVEFLGLIIIQTIYALPAIIALIINFAVKKFKIQNEKGIKITKIIYNIFTAIYLILLGFVAGIFYYLKDLDVGQ